MWRPLRGYQQVSQGWRRHCAAVALLSGLYSNMRRRKSENPVASSNRKWYFSSRTSKRLQSLSGPKRCRSPVWHTSSVTVDAQHWNVKMIYWNDINKTCDCNNTQKYLSDSPLRLKYSVEYLPDNKIAGGILPSSSMIWATWSEADRENKHTLQVCMHWINIYKVATASTYRTRRTFPHGNGLAGFGFKQGVSSDQFKGLRECKRQLKGWDVWPLSILHPNHSNWQTIMKAHHLMTLPFVGVFCAMGFYFGTTGRACIPNWQFSVL